MQVSNNFTKEFSKTNVFEGPIVFLPDDVLLKIISLVSPQIASVSRRFELLNQKAQQSNWQQVKDATSNDSFLFYLIKKVEQDSLDFNKKFRLIFKDLIGLVADRMASQEVLAKMCSYEVSNLQRLTYINEWLKDKNFLNFFNRLSLAVPEAKQYLKSLNSAIEEGEKAKVLREWMREYGDVLALLKDLNLQDCKLTEVPDEVCLLTNLRNLNLSGNQLKTVPEKIEQLVKLKTLELRNNRLETIPESIGKLVNLQGFHLWNNQLKTIPESIGLLINLEELDLADNELETIPEGIGKLNKLQSFFLDNNLLKTIPETISKLINFQNFDLPDSDSDSEEIDRIGQLIEENLLLDGIIH